MASIHVYVDLKNRQWAVPPNMDKLYHAHIDVADMDLRTASSQWLAQKLVTLLLDTMAVADAVPDNPDQLYKGHGDCGLTKVE
jgi:hypothetical protein